jgi:hypothetical protein
LYFSGAGKIKSRVKISSFKRQNLIGRAKFMNFSVNGKIGIANGVKWVMKKRDGLYFQQWLWSQLLGTGLRTIFGSFLSLSAQRK